MIDYFINRLKVKKKKLFRGMKYQLKKKQDLLLIIKQDYILKKYF